MQETRKEFLLNRTTNLVYKQLERFEKSLENFTINQNEIEYKGNAATSFLDKNSYPAYRSTMAADEEYKVEVRRTLF